MFRRLKTSILVVLFTVHLIKKSLHPPASLCLIGSLLAVLIVAPSATGEQSTVTKSYSFDWPPSGATLSSFVDASTTNRDVRTLEFGKFGASGGVLTGVDIAFNGAGRTQGNFAGSAHNGFVGSGSFSISHDFGVQLVESTTVFSGPVEQSKTASGYGSFTTNNSQSPDLQFSLSHAFSFSGPDLDPFRGNGTFNAEVFLNTALGLNVDSGALFLSSHSMSAGANANPISGSVTVTYRYDPSPPTQDVVLAWGTDVPGTWYSPSPFGYALPFRLPVGTTPAATVDPTTQTQVRMDVERMFRDAGVMNISVANGSPINDAVTVYFTDKTVPSAHGVLSGEAFTGIDRYNSDLDGKAVVFLPGTNGSIEDIAETVAHEVGHLLGLRHVDPTDTDIMLQGNHWDNEDEHFRNAVSSITDPLSFKTHNTVYHLERYVDGESDSSLRARGVQPGTWDLPGGGMAHITMYIDFDIAPSSPLYEVSVFASYPDGESDLLGHFNSLTIAELEAMSFELLQGATLNLLASSTDGGPLDTMLATGDPTVAENAGLYAEEGVFSVFLQQAVATEPSGYQTLASASMTGVPTPEPATLGLLLLGGLALLRRRK